MSGKIKFFFISENHLFNPPGIEIFNEKDLSGDKRNLFISPDPARRGFDWVQGHPHLVYKKKLGRLPGDLERLSDYWLITSRTKEVFEDSDPSAFDFIRCEIDFGTDGISKDYWICDVIRVSDCVDEKKSDVHVVIRGEQKIYSFAGSQNVFFDESVVQDSMIFRIKNSASSIICNEKFKEICKTAKIKGVMFRSSIQKQHKYW